MSVILELKTNPLLNKSFRDKAIDFGFMEKPSQITADVDPGIIFFLYNGVQSVFFSVLANYLYSALKSEKTPTREPELEIIIINDLGETRTTIKNRSQIEALTLEQEGSFVSVKFIK